MCGPLCEAVLERPGGLRSNVVASQVDLHARLAAETVDVTVLNQILGRDQNFGGVEQGPGCRSCDQHAVLRADQQVDPDPGASPQSR